MTPLTRSELASGAQYEELDSLRAALSKALSKSEFSPDLTNELCNLAATLKPGDMNNQALSQVNILPYYYFNHIIIK